MASLSRSALLPFPHDAVYRVVSDVARYREFLPWCRASTIVEQDQHAVTATLEFGTRGLREQVTTRNTLLPSERIDLTLVSGPFSEFDGVWRFTALGGGVGCKVEFDLEYRLVGRHRVLRGPFVGQAADRLVDAFAQRCADLLG